MPSAGPKLHSSRVTPEAQREQREPWRLWRGGLHQPWAAGFRPEQVQTTTLRGMRKMRISYFWHVSPNCHHSLQVHNREGIPTYFLRCHEVLTWEENITS